MNFFKEAIDALFVDALSGFQYVEVHANLGRQMDEGLHVLWKTETTVTKPGLEELSADARVESHGMRHFLDVCADFFAKIGNDVGVANFQREERIGGVLDEFGAVDGGDEEFGFVARRAGSVVHRAAESFLENGAVDFAELRGSGGILDAHDDAVGVKKIINGGAFAKKFRVGGHAVFYVAVFGIGGEGAAEFEARARGYGAFLDDQFGRFRFGGNLASHVVDGR